MSLADANGTRTIVPLASYRVFERAIFTSEMFLENLLLCEFKHFFTYLFITLAKLSKVQISLIRGRFYLSDHYLVNIFNFELKKVLNQVDKSIITPQIFPNMLQ